MAAPAYANAESVAGAWGTTTIAINKPSGTASGDLLVASIIGNSNGFATITPPSGWTTLRVLSGDSFSISGHYYKVAGGSEPSNYSWTGGTSYIGGVIHRVTGAADPPIDVSEYSEGGFTDWTLPALTTSVNDTLVVGVGTCWADDSRPSTPPSGYTERFDMNLGGGNCAFVDKEQASAGSVSSQTWDITHYSGGRGVAVHMAIAPGAGGAPPWNPALFAKHNIPVIRRAA